MMKTLKRFLEVYEPKSPDEKKFKDKHVTIKHDDRNGNGDDVFQATNVKKVERKKERHGYEPGEDEKVYEEVDLDEVELDEAMSAHDRYTATHREATGLLKSISDHLTTHKKAAMSHANYYDSKKKGPNWGHVGDLDHIHNQLKNIHDQLAQQGEYAKSQVHEEVELEEKKLTPAEMKKREEVAKAIERENPKMPMAKKMAIATATAKKVAEDIAFKAAKKYGTRIEEEVDQEEVTAADVVAEAFENGVVPKMFQPALLAIFEQLSEENQVKFVQQLQTPEGVESLINFAIQNRGE